MKKQDLVTTLAVALGTATLTVGSFWGQSLDAGNDGQPAAEIERPKLALNGVEFSVTGPDAGSIKAGDEPVLELTALNVSGESSTGTVRVAMTAMSPASALSRVAVFPESIWQCVQSLELKPGARETIVLKTGTKLPPNKVISVILAPITGDDPAAPNVKPLLRNADASSVTALHFSTAPLRPSPPQNPVDAGGKLLTAVPSIPEGDVPTPGLNL